MKTASAGLINLLANSNEFCMWEVYTITLADGSVMTWTSAEVAGTAGPSSVSGETPVVLTG